MKKHQLLVTCDAYRNFQKDPIDHVSSHFKNIFVFVRYNPVANLSNYIKIPALEAHKLSSKIDFTNKPTNISLYPTPVLYLPIDSQYKKLGEKHYRHVDSLIRRNKLQFDLVHSHFTWSSGYVGAKIKEKYGVPFVVTAHGHDIYNLPFKDEKWKSRIEYVLNSADSIITVSKSNLECIKKLDVTTSVNVLPNGYKEDLFYPMNPYECRKLLGLSVDKKIILTIGNLEEVKGHKYLIEAISNVVKWRRDIICIIIGVGKLEKELNGQISSSNLQDYVKLIGSKPHNEIPQWINACDIFVLPSLKEGNPTVLVECLGCGKPFVGTKVGGIPEIIVSEDYGLLAKPGDSNELAEKILTGLDCVWDSNRIYEYAAQFSWSKISKKIIEIYSLLE